MNWVRSIFSSVDFSCMGAFIKLASFEDNYAKKTEFISAVLVLKKNEIFIRNNDFDPEQDQIEFLSFPLSGESQICHYSVMDEEQRIQGVKWVNVNAKGQHDKFFAFEFEDAENFEAFLKHANKLVKVDEEGYQSPEHSKKNNKKSIEALKVTTHIPASNISKVQQKPDPDLPEECKSKSNIQFKREALSYLSHLYTPDTILFMASADLYLLGPNLQSPIMTDIGIGFLLIKHSKFQVTLDLVRGQDLFMRTLVDNQFYCFVDNEGKKFSWIENVPDGEKRTWRVNLNENLEGLEALINIAKFESEHKVFVSELNDDDQTWIKGVQALEINEKQDKVVVDFPNVERVEDADDEEFYDCVAGWRSSKVFAARKGKITVFDDQGQGLKNSSSIELPRNPVKILLSKKDSHLLTISDDLPNIVTEIDLAQSSQTNEFSLKDKVFLQIAHTSKLSPLTDSPLFVGLSYNGLYTLDPRDPNKIVQEFEYQTPPGFSCISTTASGHLAVGSETGEIRLYHIVGKKASTTFPSIGASIKSIDTSKCGSWILATTSEFLLVVKAEYEGELAYTKPLAKKRKPGKKLILSPEDQAKYNLLTLDFTPAKFNIFENSDETMITTSTGNLLIIWNFLSIKAGKLFDYFIKPLDEKILKTEFRFDEETAIISFKNTIISQPSRWKSV